MIGLIDSWADRPPPAGAADDDDLFAATGADAVMLVGDRGGLKRAERMGVRIAAHIGVRTEPASLVRRRIQRRLPSGVAVSPMSIWAAGMIGTTTVTHDAPATISPAYPVPEFRPFVLPIASDPQAIDACQLVLAASLLKAAGATCLLGLPTGIHAMHRSRRLLANSDRIIPVAALTRPAPAYIRSANLLLDLGITPGGAIDAACHESGVQRIDACDALTPMSIALAVRNALPTGALT